MGRQLRDLERTLRTYEAFDKELVRTVRVSLELCKTEKDRRGYEEALSQRRVKGKGR